MRVIAPWACSQVVRRRIRIAEARVRFSPGPPANLVECFAKGVAFASALLDGIMTEILKNRRDSGKSFVNKRIAGLAFGF